MKSLNSSTAEGCPFDNELFTPEILGYIFGEGFEWRDSNDSYYTYNNDNNNRNLKNYGCYKKYEDGNGTDIYIYICEDGIEIDQDYDCGGNLSSWFFPFDESFENVYDQMVKCVNNIKQR